MAELHQCVHEDRWKNFDVANATIQEIHRRMFIDNGKASIQSILRENETRMTRMEGLIAGLSNTPAARPRMEPSEHHTAVTWGSFNLGPIKVTGIAAVVVAAIVAMSAGFAYVMKAQGRMLENQSKIEKVLLAGDAERLVNEHRAVARDAEAIKRQQ